MHTPGFEKPYPPPIIGAVEDGAAAVSEQNPLLGWAGLGWAGSRGGCWWLEMLFPNDSGSSAARQLVEAA